MTYEKSKFPKLMASSAQGSISYDFFRLGQHSQAYSISLEKKDNKR